MPSATSERDQELLTQAKADNMTDDEYAKYMHTSQRRAMTAMQRKMSDRYPIWKALLKPKLNKLDEKAWRIKVLRRGAD